MTRSEHSPVFLFSPSILKLAPKSTKRLAGFLFLVMIPLISWITPVTAQTSGMSETDKTLSPYFFVHSDDQTIDQLPLLSTKVEAAVVGVIADVSIVQTYKNDGTRPIEATYVFPGSTRAAVYSMKMTIQDRVVVAEVRERQQARQIYETARQEGRSAALLEQQRPNVFQMDLANIMPGDLIQIELRYTELLVPTDGVYEFVYPTVVGPRYSNQPAAGSKDRWVASPYQHAGEAPLSSFDIEVNLVTGVPIQEVECPSHATDTTYSDADFATIKLLPEETNGGNRDFILRYRLTGSHIETGLLLAPGQDENFFLLMAQPPQRVEPENITPREYIFILDVSGSMNGFPLETSKTLMRNLLSKLRLVDTFNILFFSSDNWMLSEQPLYASPENIRHALAQIDSQHGGGNTELLPALREALAFPSTEGRSRNIVIATDGYVDVETEAFELIRNNLGDANFFAFGIGRSVNRHLIEGLAYAGRGEPFIVTSPQEAEATAARLLKYIESPVLTRIRLEYEGFDAYEIEPLQVADMFAQRPVIVFGKWRGGAQGAITVNGQNAQGLFQKRIEVAEASSHPWASALRYLWARDRIKAFADYGDTLGVSQEQRVQDVTQLGLKYNLLTPYTSFVAVDYVVRSDVQPEKVQQPLPMPEGVSDLAVGERALNAIPSHAITSTQEVADPGRVVTYTQTAANLGGLITPEGAATRSLSYSTEVEVIGTIEYQILESASLTGTVIQEDYISQLPLLGNNAMEMLSIMGGVVRAENPIFDASNQTLAGVTGANVNISRDGITVNEIRYNSGITSPNHINRETVGEFRMVLTPIDAEMGRGAGQVQSITRAGSNAFHGSGVWNIQNTALDAYEYEDKNQAVVNPREWRNLNSYTLTLSGPIIRNKTFFFVSWDQQIVRTRTSYNAQVLTPCARKGIYRYLDGVRSADAAATPQVAGESFTPAKNRPSVDYNGRPLETYTWPNDPSLGAIAGTTETNSLRYQSVLGQLDMAAWNQIAADPVNCSQYNFDISNGSNSGVTTAWDAYRNEYDKSGLVGRFSTLMPLPNDYQIGDGLNLAGHRWTRTVKGEDSVFGIGKDNLRKAITFKLDHNINYYHRVSGTYSYERDSGEDALPVWPEEYGGYGGLVRRSPQTFTVALASTLAPTLLNEFRVGLSRTKTKTIEPLDHPETGEALSQMLQHLLPTNNFPRYANLPVLAGPGGDSVLFHPEGDLNSQPYGSRGNLPATWGGVDPRWTVSDTITWMKGAHSFKGGFEFRRNQSRQESNGLVSFAGGGNVWPSIKGGVLTDYSPYADYALSSPGLSGQVNPDGTPLWGGMPQSDDDYRRGNAASGNWANAYGMMTYMTGSVGDISQFFFVTDAQNPRWNHAGENNYVVDLRNWEFSSFFKDEWKITSNLTLNLGVRHEYYGVPWVESGLTAGVRNGVAGMFGLSGGDFSTWMPTVPTVAGAPTEQIFVGPNSPNPEQRLFNKDLNNFAPHVGFAWQLPWFGRGLTTLRGGYSISYTAVGNFDSTSGYGAVAAYGPGSVYTYHYTGDPTHPYLNFNNIADLVPLVDASGFIGLAPDKQPSVVGGNIVPVQQRNQALAIYDPDIRNPYVQNMSLSLTRNIGNYITADVRYIGTLSRKTIRGLNLNSVNFINNGLFDALNIVRQGGDSPLLDQYIRPGTLYASTTDASGNTVIDHTLTGSQQVRRQYQQQLANGDFAAIAANLATNNGDPNGVLGHQPRNVNGVVLRVGGAPENFIYANPQYAAATVNKNLNHSNYHSMQAEITMRPRRGLNFQTTYTWSRNLARQATTDYREFGADYWLSEQHRSHVLTSYGSYELPFGAYGFWLRDFSGVAKKAIEGWQLSWIASVTSGVPDSIKATNTLWANGAPNQVGPFDPKSGEVTWNEGADFGRFFGTQYVRIPDPGCAVVDNTDVLGYDAQGGAITLQTRCNGYNGLRALGVPNGVDAAGNPTHQVIFQNAAPGERGNFQGNNLTGPGRWNLDMAMWKSIEFMEGKKIEFRVDAQNIFNHATPSNNMLAWNARFTQIYNPDFNLNNPWNDFGYLNTKGGHRTFQAKIRLSF